MNAVYALWKREILRFVRQRSRLIGALVTPLLFWAVVGGGLGQSFRDPNGTTNGGYLEFFYPGAVVLSVLFTAIFSTMSVIEDRHQGFLQGVLVSPVPRASFVAAKILGGATLGAVQGALLLALAPVIGLSVDGAQFLELFGLLFVMGAALTALGFVFAWKIDSVQGYHGVMNIVLMPMWMLSGSVFPDGGTWKLFRWVQALNPLSYGVGIFRAILSHQPSLLVASMPVSWMVIVVFGAVLTAAGVFVASQTQRA
ncbi:MAG: ABC transporter permease [Bdellovibrionales bacterium]|nr:ABC transporter permease [Bdellovibrionales bacterium]